MISGYDKIACGWRVDQVDLARAEFRNKSNPEQAYINYIMEYFEQYLLNIHKKVMAYKARTQNRILLPNQQGIQFNSEVSGKEQDAFKQLLYERQLRKKKMGLSSNLRIV